MEYRVRDGVLSIEETSAVSDTIYINIDFTEEILSGGKQSETGVILYVPEKKVLKKIEVTMGFGDVQMNGIQAESGRLQNADGDITLFGCDMQNIKCKADYGDVELKSGNVGEWVDHAGGWRCENPKYEAFRRRVGGKLLRRY